ncbi:SH3 domain-containing protein [Cytobacillus purgationiresistens]|uniref:N-acetylmuramoyl-L-alanine amidase n=1 Tax=Cytobacillus purgationiresistens TaxID=863449 RepID=A0ABU0AGE3_9BACI|nr:SH3 domain-containing protein [Cytobacillus purgationiresistens]MDQ0269857.1 N-acetylmuramoyl-L-alanine amidase [Cytobacillus purgationiresistens]
MVRRKNFMMLVCLILLAGIVFPQPKAIAEGKNVKIATDILNVRTGPGLSYPVLGIAEKGEQFTMLSQQDEWIEIDFGSKGKGWVADWLVVLDSPQSASAPTKTEQETVSNSQATVNTDGLRVRGGPATDKKVLGLIGKGEYRLVSQQGDWVELETVYGNGWVAKEFVDFSRSTQKSEKHKSSAKTKTGTIIGDALNVRSEPSQANNIIGKLTNGETVEILSQQNDWTEISYAGSSAWISSQYVRAHSNDQTDENQQTTKQTAGQSGKVTAGSLTVRESPSLNGKNIGTVSHGQTFAISEEENNWFKIEYKPGVFGWVAGWYIEKSGEGNTQQTEAKSLNGGNVTILQNGSNIRKKASTQSDVLQLANQGDVFEVISLQNDWYEVKLAGGASGFIAGWIVSADGSVPKVENPGGSLQLGNKTIVIDPGHGGRDNGTTGASGTLEKTLNMRTAEILSGKLKAAGANVVLTRQQDTYIPLQSRVSTSHMHNADAFISIHYDSIEDRSIRGMTTYYHHSYQQELAADVHTAASAKVNIPDRGYRQGDYFVIRENNRKAILLELGYLSNPTEEMLVSSAQYQEAVATGIFQGLAKHFSN